MAGAVLALAPAANAAIPFTAGTGTGHDIAVAPDGTAHVVWITNEADDRIGYCRVPPGGSACDSESGFLTFPDADATASAQGSAQVFTSGASAVAILAGCTQCPSGDVSTNTYAQASANSGVSFTGSGPVGDLGLSGQSAHLGGANVLGVAASRIQGMPSGPASPIDLGGGSYSYSASAALVPGMNEAVYAVNNLATVKYRIFNSASTTPATVNTAGNWSSDRFIAGAEADNAETHLSSGGNGVLLTYKSTFSPGDLRVGLRRYDPTTNTFGSAAYIEGPSAVDDNGLDFPHHSQDAGNRIHVVWRTLHDGGRLRYTRSDDGGTSFFAPGNLAGGESFQDPLVEAGTAGTGFAVWRNGSGQIRVVAIDPQPEPTPPGGGPGGGTPGGDTTAPTAGGFSAGDTTLFPGQGTSFTFTSSEAGMARLTVQKQVPGLKVRVRGRTRCLPRTRRRLRALRRQAGSRAEFRRLLRRRRCTAYKRIGSIQQRVTPGRNTIVFNGRIAGRRLRPGRYRALLRITDSAGNVSRVERIRFRVLRRRR